MNSEQRAYLNSRAAHAAREFAKTLPRPLGYREYGRSPFADEATRLYKQRQALVRKFDRYRDRHNVKLTKAANPPQLVLLRQHIVAGSFDEALAVLIKFERAHKIVPILDRKL